MAGRALRALLTLIGVVATFAGLWGVLGGTAWMAGEASASASVDGELRYLSAFYAAYGLAALHVARGRADDALAVRALAGAMLLGGLGRALGWAIEGRPGAPYVALLALELTVPVALVALHARAAAGERVAGGARP